MFWLGQESQFLAKEWMGDEGKGTIHGNFGQNIVIIGDFSTNFAQSGVKRLKITSNYVLR